jgi:RNA polymerase sigma factor (sigma-70 family)
MLASMADGAGPTDETLVRRFAAVRDEAAFSALVDRYAALVREACRRRLRDPSLADDATQAVFLVLARRSGSLIGRPWTTRPLIADWLLRTASLICRDLDRQRRRRLRHEAAAVADRPREQLTADPLRDDVAEAVESLPMRYRQVVVLHYYLGLDRAAIAGELQLKPDAVDKRLQRAHGHLERRLRAVAIAPTLAALRVPGDQGEAAAMVRSGVDGSASTMAAAAASAVGHAPWMWPMIAAAVLAAAIGVAVLSTSAGHGVNPLQPHLSVAPADPPPTANRTGFIRFDLGGDDWASSVVPLADGRLLVSGVGGAADHRRAFVSRRLANGAPDPSYGDGGIAWCSEPASTAYAFDLVQVEGGRAILALVTAAGDGKRKARLAVLDADGHLVGDGIDPRRATDMAEDDEPARLRCVVDGRGDLITALSWTAAADAGKPARERPTRAAVQRIELSPHWGQVRMCTRIDSTTHRNLAVVGAPLALADGRLLLPLASPTPTGERIAIARTGLDGGLDPSFGDGGIWMPTITAQGMGDTFADSTAYALLGRPDGGFLIAGRGISPSEAGAPAALIARCTASAEFVAAREDQPNIMASSSDDRQAAMFFAVAAIADGFVAVGKSGDRPGRGALVVRFTAFGAAMPGPWIARLSGADDDAYAVAVSGDRLVIAGRAGPAGHGDVLIARMTLDRHPDRSFGDLGEPPAPPTPSAAAAPAKDF